MKRKVKCQIVSPILKKVLIFENFLLNKIEGFLIDFYHSNSNPMLNNDNSNKII